MLVSISGVISESWRLYKTHWRSLLVYMVFLFVPTLIMAGFGWLGMLVNRALPTTALASNIIVFVIFIVGLIFNMWASLAVIRAVAVLHATNSLPGWKQAFSATARLLWPFIYTSVLVGIIVLGGTLLLLIPGIIFAVWYAFAAVAVVVDEKRGRAALSASKTLVKGRWWAMLALLIVPNIFFAIISGLLGALISALALRAVSSAGAQAVSGNFISALIGSVAAPLTASAMVILYQSAKNNPLPAPPLPSAPASPPYS